MYFESQRKKHTILTERLHTHTDAQVLLLLGLGRGDAKRTLQILEKILYYYKYAKRGIRISQP